jgi:phospholipid/cholesterol/gamma-HCH transport system substrate-binding protein
VEVKKEFKVGILVIAALAILYFGIGFLKGSDIFNPARSYFVAYENVDGLTASNPVMLDGFQVGLVRRIKIFQGRKKPVVVELEINKDIIIGDSAKALLSNNGLLGGKMIVLDPGSRLKVLEGDTLIASVAPGFTSMLEDKAQPMVDKVTALVNSVDGLIHSFEPTVGKMNESLEAITKLSNTSNAVMTDSKQDIAHITQNLDKLSKSLLDAEKQLESIMTKVGKLGDSLNKADLAGTIHSLHRTTEQLNKTMVALNQGQGTMGKLLKSDSLYRNLNASSASLNALLIDFKANPKRYVHFSVFGSKDKKSSSGSSK